MSRRAVPRRRLGGAFLSAALVAALAACGSSSSSGGSGINVGNETVPSSVKSIVNNTTSTSDASLYPKGCTPVAQPKPRSQPHLKAPTTKLDPSKRYTVTMVTNCGQFQFALAVHNAPKTAASVASLVQQGFYNGLDFHRIVPGFVIQGGDPLGNGQGGPGYQVVEAPPANLKYKIGYVAMAKTASEPNGASGSQFFIVTGPQGTSLPPQYALAGHVTTGLPVVLRIAKVPVASPQTGMPEVPVVISSATLTTG
jgi:cyclophilin family peptidyl-prolyl cis-trans isomerase